MSELPRLDAKTGSPAPGRDFLDRTAGIGTPPPGVPGPRLIQYINLKLAALGCPTVVAESDPELQEMTTALLAHQRETGRLLASHLCPADNRIQTFLYDYLQGAPLARLPAQTLALDRYGLARALSLPPTSDEFASDIINSYRVRQGVLHNPKSDRRTTQGIFHVAEGGLPVPDDKMAVPVKVLGRMLQLALTPPPELLRLPFTSAQAAQAECFVSLLIRPIVCPEVPGFIAQKAMEIRFFVPGSLVSNLDFVESIFGNGGDPFLPENDAEPRPRALDGPHRLRRARAAPHDREEKRRGPAAVGCGDGAPAPRRHVLERRGRAL